LNASAILFYVMLYAFSLYCYMQGKEKARLYDVHPSRGAGGDKLVSEQ